jgi:hypothetical protein
MSSAPDLRTQRGFRWGLVAEGALIAGLSLLYFFGFPLASPVHGPYEVFDQDSAYLLESLVRGEPYAWNPQNHLLYHVLVELGHRPWTEAFGSGLESTYRYLKVFTALTGVGFLIALRWLLVELRLGLGARMLLMCLTGLSVSIWFHFSAFETHSLALPFLAVYLVCLVRLRDRETRTARERNWFVASLLVMAWTRIDLLRFAAGSLLLPLLPATRRWAKSLFADFAKVAVIGVIGITVLTSLYRSLPLEEALVAAFQRNERSSLEEKVGKRENFTGQNFYQTGRALLLYGILMPVAPRDPQRGFLAPPTYRLGLEWREGEDRPSTGLFLEPIRNFTGSAWSLVAAVGLLALLAVALVSSLRRAVTGDPLHMMVLAHAIGGWVLYTWFNPYEPFLWVVEFVPIWIVLIAELMRGRPTWAWISLGVLTGLFSIHNLFAFYLPFR